MIVNYTSTHSLANQHRAHLHIEFLKAYKQIVCLIQRIRKGMENGHYEKEMTKLNLLVV